MSRPQDIRVMRSEITTLEQFDKIGAPARVGMRYGVDHADALKWRRELEAIEKGEGGVSKNDNSHNRADKMRAEIATVEQIKKLGGVAGVARQYKVTYPTAHKHCQEIESREKPKEIPISTQPELAPSESEGAPEGDRISEVENVPERTAKALAVELIAKVREQETSVMLAKIGAYFGHANQAMDDLLKTESKIDRLMYEIQADLLKVVEKELRIALEGE